MILLFLPLNVLLAQDEEEFFLTLKVNNKPLSTALEKITNQTGYYLTYDSRLVDASRTISMQLESVSLQKAIDTLFKRKDLSYRIINKNIVIFPTRSTTFTEQEQDTLSENNLTEINGIVKDARSGKPLQYATVALMDTYLGTISNEDGSFQLRVKDTVDNPILISSYIGYKNQYTPISINSSTPIEIQMYKNLISLQEVIIRYQDPVKLLSESISRLDENYMKEEAGMKAYYRESVLKEDKFMSFSEAIFDIAKSSYNAPLTSDRNRLVKGRKLINTDIQDTIIMKIRSGFISILNLDIAKYRPDFLSEDFFLRYNLQLSDIVSYKDRLVYVISFKQKENIKALLFEGDLYLDMNSLAIVAADFRYDPIRIQNEPDIFIAKKSIRIKVRPVKAEYHVEYRNAGDNYYLSQAQGNASFKIRKRRQWISSKYSINIDLAITDVKPGNPPKIRFNEQLKPSTVITDHPFTYDPEFWGSYNTITPELSLSESLEKIKRSNLEINE